MKQATNFYRIGLFTTLGLAIFIMFLLAMGGRSWFDRSMYIETYFDESVQGLEVGSDVKYRGVKIGKVTKIDFVNDIYDIKRSKDNLGTFNHSVYVLMTVDLKLFSQEDQLHIGDIFKEAVHDGMRVHLAPQGLTGSSYFELDFYNPGKNPPLKINWTPLHPYIPSKQSTLSQISENLNKFIQGLGDANVGDIMRNIDRMTSQTSQAMSKINMILSDQQQNLEASMSNMRIVSGNLRSLTDNAKNYPSSLIFGSKPPKLDLSHEQKK
jgi:paraquat-inducible protein B